MQTITPSRPLWLRIPRAVVLGIGFVLAVLILFVVAPMLELTGGGK